MLIWQGTYQDRHGTEQVEFHNDGSTIRVRIRGVEFAGSDFNCLDPDPAQQLDGDAFELDLGSLTSCTMRWEIPLTVVSEGRPSDGMLQCRLLLAAPSSPRRAGREDLHLTLLFEDTRVETHDAHQLFGTALDELHLQLPPQVSVKSCISCAWSDYHPAGNALLGGMGCFRAHKEAYRSVRGKSGIFALWSRDTPHVQETWLCPEHERRGHEGTGYRGSFPFRRPSQAT